MSIAALHLRSAQSYCEELYLLDKVNNEHQQKAVIKTLTEHEKVLSHKATTSCLFLVNIKYRFKQCLCYNLLLASASS